MRIASNAVEGEWPLSGVQLCLYDVPGAAKADILPKILTGTKALHAIGG